MICRYLEPRIVSPLMTYKKGGLLQVSLLMFFCYMSRSNVFIELVKVSFSFLKLMFNFYLANMLCCLTLNQNPRLHINAMIYLGFSSSSFECFFLVHEKPQAWKKQTNNCHIVWCYWIQLSKHFSNLNWQFHYCVCFFFFFF